MRAVITIVSIKASVTLDPLARNPVALDAVGLDDLFAKVVAYRRAPVDSAGAQDAVDSRNVGKVVVETVGATDDLNGALGADDDQVIGFTKALNRTAAVSDVRVSATSKLVSDSAAASDVQTTQLARPVVETVAAQDSALRVAQYVRALPEIYALEYFADDYTATEKAVASDTRTLAIFKPKSHESRVADAAARDVAKLLAHAALSGDVRWVGVDKPFADAGGAGDAVASRAVGKARANTAGARDSGAVAMPASYASDYFASDYCGLLSSW